MSTVGVLAALAIAIVAAGIAGPALVHQAAPVLMRVPGAAMMLLVAILLLWLLAITSFSLMAAWITTGPDILPTPVASTCQRCLEAASPVEAGATIGTVVPVVAFLLIPAVGLVSLVGIGLPPWSGRRRANATAARHLARSAKPARIDGYDIRLLRDPRPVAFSLPRRSGGVVVSEGLLEILQADELTAVLEHEDTHVRQQHHAILAALDALSRPLHWVPLVAAIRDAVPHYAEISADKSARARAGTAVLARALLKIGDAPSTPVAQADRVAFSAALQIAGPDRIGHLVAPTRLRASVLPTAGLAALLAAFTLTTAAVYAPYIAVLLGGCLTS